MRKSLIIAVVCFCCVVTVYAQRTDSYSFHIIYDGENGFYKSNILDTTGGATNDILVGKYDSLNQEEWSMLYGGVGKELVSRFVATGGNYFALGYTYSKGAGLSDMLVVQSTSTGFSKALILGESNADDAVNLLEYNTAGNKLLLLGTSEVSVTKTDAIYSTLDAKLNPLSSFQIDLPGKDLLSVAVFDTVSHAKIFAGKTNLLAGNGDDMLVLKVDSSEQLIWARILANSYRQEVNDMLIDVSGNIYLVGYENDGTGYKSLLVKLDSTGNMVYQRTYQSSVGNRFLRAVWDQGNLIVGGVVSTISGSYDDFMLVKLDSDGNIIWSGNYSHPTDEYVTSLSLSDTGYILSGPVKYSSGWSYQVIETDKSGKACRWNDNPLTPAMGTLLADTLSGSIYNFIYQYQLDSAITFYSDTTYAHELCLLRSGAVGLPKTVLTEGVEVNYLQDQHEIQITNGKQYQSFDVMLMDCTGRILKTYCEEMGELRISRNEVAVGQRALIIVKVIAEGKSYSRKLILP